MSTALLRCALGDLPILAGSLRLPTGRPWLGVVDVHATAELPALSPASIVLTRENKAEDLFVGTVRKNALNDGRAQLSVTVVAGKGLLARSIGPRDHAKGTTEIPAGLLARGIVTDAGEQLAPGVEAALDALTVPHWHRVAGPGSAALDVLVSFLGLVWRMLPDGLVWVGVGAGAPGPDLRRLGFNLEDGGRRYGPDGGQVLPGQILESRKLVDVVYHLGGPLRAEARASVAGDAAHAPDVELYRRTWSARVVSQDATTGLLDLVCDDARLGELRGIPLRCGIPGARVFYQAPAGERVRLAFDGADPRLPYAEDCDQTGAPVHGVARVGDATDSGTLEGLANLNTGVVTFSYTPPGGSRAQVVTVHLGGRITTGSPEVQIR